MGLDCSHDAWHGAYSAFMRWRTEIAKAAGLPPLELMEGFYSPLPVVPSDSTRPPTFYLGFHQEDLVLSCFRRLDDALPIRWGCLKPSALHELLYHSDCDGKINPSRCGPIADALEKLLPKLNGDYGGHVGDIRAKTETFIKGLRAAAKAKQSLRFG